MYFLKKLISCFLNAKRSYCPVYYVLDIVQRIGHLYDVWWTLRLVLEWTLADVTIITKKTDLDTQRLTQFKRLVKNQTSSVPQLGWSWNPWRAPDNICSESALKIDDERNAFSNFHTVVLSFGRS